MVVDHGVHHRPLDARSVAALSQEGGLELGSRVWGSALVSSFSTFAPGLPAAADRTEGRSRRWWCSAASTARITRAGLRLTPRSTRVALPLSPGMRFLTVTESGSRSGPMDDESAPLRPAARADCHVDCPAGRRQEVPQRRGVAMAQHRARPARLNRREPPAPPASAAGAPPRTPRGTARSAAPSRRGAGPGGCWHRGHGARRPRPALRGRDPRPRRFACRVRGTYDAH